MLGAGVAGTNMDLSPGEWVSVCVSGRGGLSGSVGKGRGGWYEHGPFAG